MPVEKPNSIPLEQKHYSCSKHLNTKLTNPSLKISINPDWPTNFSKAKH